MDAAARSSRYNRARLTRPGGGPDTDPSSRRGLASGLDARGRRSPRSPCSSACRWSASGSTAGSESGPRPGSTAVSPPSSTGSPSSPCSGSRACTAFASDGPDAARPSTSCSPSCCSRSSCSPRSSCSSCRTSAGSSSILLFPSQAILTIAAGRHPRSSSSACAPAAATSGTCSSSAPTRPARSFADLLGRHASSVCEPIGYLAGPQDRGERRRRARAAAGPGRPPRDRGDPALDRRRRGRDLPAGRATGRWSSRSHACARTKGRVVRIPIVGPGLMLPGGRMEEVEGVEVLSLVYGPDRTLGMLAKRAIDVAARTHRAGAAEPAAAPRGGRHPAARRRAGAVPPGAGRPARPAVPGGQVPHDGARCRGAPGRARGASTRSSGPAFKLTDDPRLTRTGRLAPPDEHRRAAPALERAARRDEPGRSAAAAAERGPGLRHLAPPAPVDAAGHHRALAGRGAARGRLRPLGPARPRLHRPLVAVAGPQDHPVGRSRPSSPARGAEARRG